MKIFYVFNVLGLHFLYKNVGFENYVIFDSCFRLKAVENDKLMKNWFLDCNKSLNGLIKEQWIINQKKIMMPWFGLIEEI